MNLLATVLKHCTTGLDGETYDVGRILLIVGALAFLVMSIYHVWKHGVFDPISFGTGYSGLLTISCGGLKLKESTEPKGNQ